MTNHADRSSPKDNVAPAGGTNASGSGETGSQVRLPRQDRDELKDPANPQLSEAIDRATAADGQDDGKR